MVNVPQDGVRTFLPLRLLSRRVTLPLHPPKPAITRPARQLSLYTVRSLKILLLLPSARPRIQRMRVREAKNFLVRCSASWNGRKGEDSQSAGLLLEPRKFFEFRLGENGYGQL